LVAAAPAEVMDGPDATLVLTSEIRDVEPINELLRRGIVVIIATDLGRAAERIGRLAIPSDVELPGSKELSFGRLRINVAERVVRSGSDVIPLSQREFRILECLASDPGCARSFRDLLRDVWNIDDGRYRVPVHSAIKRLRSKLASYGVGERIDSVPGFGFRLATSSAPPDDAA
jgi:DNA-binding response OmpR family regulator